MTNEDHTYADPPTSLQSEVLEFLRTFESIQEQLRPGALLASQARLVKWRAAPSAASRQNSFLWRPLENRNGSHQALCAAVVRELAKANDIFMSKPGPEWTLAFLQ